MKIKIGKGHWNEQSQSGWNYIVPVQGGSLEEFLDAAAEELAKECASSVVVVQSGILYQKMNNFKLMG
jgi:hypothetical protein